MMHTAFFGLLDLVIHTRTDDAPLASRIEGYLDRHRILAPTQSPDLCIWLPSLAETDVRFLFRDSLDDPWRGGHIRYRLPHAPWRTWDFHAPPLIPHSLPAIAQKFAAFHGATVSVGGTGLTMLGNKTAGKSSLSLGLCRRHGFALVSDENSVIDLRSLEVRALLRPPHGYVRASSGKIARVELAFSNMPWLRTADRVAPQVIVELRHIPGVAEPVVSAVHSHGERIAMLSAHSLSFGSKVDVANLLARLSGRGRYYTAIHGGYGHFEKLEGELANIFSKESELDHSA